ncbi:MAG: flagellar basal body-associated FliL family protein [Pseudomonadales bacterium]
MAKKEELELEEGEKKGSSKLILMIAAVLLGIGVGAGAVFFLVGGGGEEEVVDAEPVKVQSKYHRFDSPFIVTIVTEGKQRYLQISVTVKTKDDEVLKLLKSHKPVVKSLLNNIFGAQELDYLQTPEGRKELNADALNVVQTFITAKDETLTVDKVLFTDFVMQ